MPVSKVYSKSGQDAIATYNYEDISDGTGVVQFLGFNKYTSAAVTYGLTNQTIYSQDIEISGTVGTNTDWDFDLSKFNKPQIIKGTAIVRCSVNWAGGNGHKFVLTFRIMKIDKNGEETLIAENDSEQRIGSGSQEKKNFVTYITIPQTKFKKGESLRLNVFTAGISTAIGTLYLGIDPANRDGAQVTPAATYPTKLECYIPFKLNID